MADSSKMSIGRIVLQLAVGLMLSVAGIWALQGGGDAAADAIRSIFDGNVESILVIVLGIIEVVAGVLLIVGLFLPTSLGAFNSILLLVVMIVWICAIVLIDFLGGHGLFNGGAKHFLSWCYQFADHLIVLGALILLQSRS
ncbi:MAG: hypothetical protein IIT58_02690 [Treponema sp.]|nr:hypothetical protein [Treponema sp.]